MLTRSQILGAKLPTKEIEVPEWDGSVYVRALSGRDLDRLERMISKGEVSRAEIAALCVVDASGERMFSDEDVEALSQTQGAALEKVVSEALRFNSLTEEGIEDAAGNS